MKTGPDSFAARLALIALAAFALRIAIRLAVGTERYWIDGYGLTIDLAESIGAGRGYAFADGVPTAYRVPLYPLFIWAVTGGGHRLAWALIAAQAAVSAGTAVLAGLAARRMAGPAAGLFAAALYAAWPYAAWHDVSLQESGLFAFLAMAATLAVLRTGERPLPSRAALAGLATGLALLTRATLAGWTLGALAWLALLAQTSAVRRLALAALAALTLALTLAPWLERQHRLVGTWGLGTESGAALYAGNHALTFSVYPEGSIDESRARIFAALSPAERARLSHLNEGQQDAWFARAGRAAILADPAAFARGALVKLWAAFGPWPSPRHSAPANLAYMAGWLPFLALALAGMALRRRHWAADFPLWWHLPSFMATSAVFWAHTSHRSYLDPVLAVYGGIALAALVSRSPSACRRNEARS